MKRPLLAGEIAEAVAANAYTLESLPGAIDDVDPAEVGEHANALVSMGTLVSSDLAEGPSLTLSDNGRLLLRVMEAARNWLGANPVEAIDLDTATGREIVADWFAAWNLLITHQLVATPRSLETLAKNLPWIDPIQLERIVEGLVSRSALEPLPSTGSEATYGLAEWGRKGFGAPLQWQRWLFTSIPNAEHQLRPEHFELMILASIPAMQQLRDEVPDGPAEMTLTGPDGEVHAQVWLDFADGRFQDATVMRPTETQAAPPGLASELQETLPEALERLSRQPDYPGFVAPPPVKETPPVQVSVLSDEPTSPLARRLIEISTELQISGSRHQSAEEIEDLLAAASLNARLATTRGGTCTISITEQANHFGGITLTFHDGKVSDATTGISPTRADAKVAAELDDLVKVLTNSPLLAELRFEGDITLCQEAVEALRKAIWPSA